jgi:hypothetical protein
MTTATLTDELRTLFRQGATVARLILHARDSLGPEAPRRDYLKAVREAFGLGVAGWYLPAYTESFGNGDYPDSKLTWVFLGDILTRRDDWDDGADSTPWYAGLTKSTIEELVQAVGDHHGLSPEGWAALDEKDRERLIGLQASQIGLGEDIQLLAALAERLQQRVNELEQQLPAAVGTGTTEQQPT